MVLWCGSFSMTPLRTSGSRLRSAHVGSRSAVAAVPGPYEFLGGVEIDIAAYTEVLHRHRRIVAIGIALTFVLAVLSYVRVSPSGLYYRSPEIWSNHATLVLTQEGAPELRSVLPDGEGGLSSGLADTGRFTALIDVYTTLATGDAVVDKLKRLGLLTADDLKDGSLPISADAVPSTVNAATPMMTITGNSITGPKATKLTLATMRAFLDVVRARQVAAKIPVDDRVQLRVVKSAEAPELVNPRSKALPVLVFLGGLIATLAIAFTRDNYSRRGRAPELTRVTSHDEPKAPDTSVGATNPRLTPRPVLRPESATAHEDTRPAVGVSSGRSTLGSVPRADSPTPRQPNLPEDVPRQARRSRSASS